MGFVQIELKNKNEKSNVIVQEMRMRTCISLYLGKNNIRYIVVVIRIYLMQLIPHPTQLSSTLDGRDGTGGRKD